MTSHRANRSPPHETGSPSMPPTAAKPVSAANSNVCAATWLARLLPRSVDGDGLVVYELKHPFSDGTPHVLFEPVDFIAWPSPPWCLDRVPISSDITVCSPPLHMEVPVPRSTWMCESGQRPTPSPHRAPAHLAHQHRAKRKHERSAHSADDLDGPAKARVRYRRQCVSQRWGPTLCDWRSCRAQDNRAHPRARLPS